MPSAFSNKNTPFTLKREEEGGGAVEETPADADEETPTDAAEEDARKEELESKAVK